MARHKLIDPIHQEIAAGPVCPFWEHSIASRDGRIPRFTDSHACVQCVEDLTSRRCSLDVHRIHPHWRRIFLEFWSLVEIRSSSECWPWHGTRRNDHNSGYFNVPRHWTTSKMYSPYRVAFWLTWGDIGNLPIHGLCRDPMCCNPLHHRAQKVEHYFVNQRLQLMTLDFSSKVLARQTAAFLRGSRGGHLRHRRTYDSQNLEWILHRLEVDDASTEQEIQDVQLLVSGVSADPAALLPDEPKVFDEQS